MFGSLFKRYMAAQIVFNHQAAFTLDVLFNRTLIMHFIKPLLHSLTPLLSNMYQIINFKEIP